MAYNAKFLGYGPNAYAITNSNGSLKRPVDASAGAVIFPVGRSAYNPATISNAGLYDTYTVRVLDQVLTEGTSGTAVGNDVVGRTWIVNEVVPGNSDVTLKLQWLNTEELTSFDRASCGIAHYVGTSSSWADPASTNAATDEGAGYWSTYLSGINTFSPFAVEDDDMPLPVELLSFTAKQRERHVDLEWVTAIEINNHYFEVERAADGEHFSPILRQEGAGNSSWEIRYTDIDPDPLPGWSYYRLKQVDFDGTVHYSQLEPVYYRAPSQNMDFNLFPNPNSGSFTLEIPEQAYGSTVRILDVSGRLVSHAVQVSQVHERFVVPCAAGTYMVDITGDFGRHTIPVVIE